jgi:hypothetical protein
LIQQHQSVGPTPNSPDFSLWDFLAFSSLKKTIKGHRFQAGQRYHNYSDKRLPAATQIAPFGGDLLACLNTHLGGLYLFAQNNPQIDFIQQTLHFLKINILTFRFTLLKLYAIHIFVPLSWFLIDTYQLIVKQSIQYELVK